PKAIFSLTKNEIKVGEKANLTLFDPERKWTFEKSDIRSKSKNTPFVGIQFTGKALGIIC
ncbi:MAG: dihydroorotase, partial [Flavobacteriales bacterium]